MQTEGLELAFTRVELYMQLAGVFGFDRAIHTVWSVGDSLAVVFHSRSSDAPGPKIEIDIWPWTDLQPLGAG